MQKQKDQMTTTRYDDDRAMKCPDDCDMWPENMNQHQLINYTPKGWPHTPIQLIN